MKVIARKGSFTIVFCNLLAKSYHPIRVPISKSLLTRRDRNKNNNSQIELFPFTSNYPWCYNYIVRNIHVVTEHSIERDWR